MGGICAALVSCCLFVFLVLKIGLPIKPEQFGEHHQSAEMMTVDICDHALIIAVFGKVVFLIAPMAVKKAERRRNFLIR
jgi:hypothetical protein